MAPNQFQATLDSAPDLQCSTQQTMKTILRNRYLAPLLFLLLYLLDNLAGSALYVIRFQIFYEGGRAPTEPGGWFVSTIFCTIVVMLNLCGLNQILFLACCLWRKLRDRLSVAFALISGVVFSYFPLTIKNAMRFASGHTIGVENNTARDYAISWTISAIAFLCLALICAVFIGNNQKSLLSKIALLSKTESWRDDRA